MYYVVFKHSSKAGEMCLRLRNKKTTKTRLVFRLSELLEAIKTPYSCSTSGVVDLFRETRIGQHTCNYLVP